MKKRKKREPLKNPKAISEILSGVLSGRGFDKKIRQYSIFEAWGEIVGPTISKHSRPAKMQGDTLIVEAKSATWVQELTFMKSMILKKINEISANSGISDIRFTQQKK